MAWLNRLLAAFAEGFFPERSFRRQMRNALPAELGSLADNTFARVIGTVGTYEHRLLEAPLSGRLCVYYSVQVIAVGKSGGIEHRTEIGSEQEGITFMLSDETGHAVIVPDHARISAAFDHETRSAAGFDADARQRAVLDRLRLIDRDWFWTHHVMYREAVLEADERIAVVGAAVREPDPRAIANGLYRDARPLRLRFTGTARYPLVISDDPATEGTDTSA